MYDLNNIKIKFLFDQCQTLDISDEEYFSDKYKDYISNSSLAYINPEQNGGPYEYMTRKSITGNTSLDVGSVIHMDVLQDIKANVLYIDKPKGAKISLTVDRVVEEIKKGSSKEDAFRAVFDLGDYYAKNYEIFYRNVAEYDRYIESKLEGKYDYILTKEDCNNINNCISALADHKNTLLRPKDLEYYNELTIICPIEISFTDSDVVKTLYFKCKIDNFTVDDKKRKLVLNDLKTTYRRMEDFHMSIDHYHYYRQMALYLYVLSNSSERYKNYQLQANILAVSTTDYSTGIFRFSQEDIKKGSYEFINLIKRVGFHETFGYDRLIDDL